MSPLPGLGRGSQGLSPLQIMSQSILRLEEVGLKAAEGTPWISAPCALAQPPTGYRIWTSLSRAWPSLHAECGTCARSPSGAQLRFCQDALGEILGPRDPPTTGGVCSVSPGVPTQPGAPSPTLEPAMRPLPAQARSSTQPFPSRPATSVHPPWTQFPRPLCPWSGPLKSARPRPQPATHLHADVLH